MPNPLAPISATLSPIANPPTSALPPLKINPPVFLLILILIARTPQISLQIPLKPPIRCELATQGPTNETTHLSPRALCLALLFPCCVLRAARPAIPCHRRQT